MKTTTIEIPELLGQTCIDVKERNDKTELIFQLSSEKFLVFYHERDCCEEVYIEDICGDLKDLIDSPIVQAEFTTNNSDRTEDKSETWTFYRFATQKGSVCIRWYGVSNGYYSEEVSYKIVDSLENFYGY